MATILVTGGAGYIGSHACKLLAEAGHTPVVYDNLSNGHAEAVRWGPLETGDLRDRRRLDAVLAAHRPSSVLHFAGLIEVGLSVRDPLRFYDNNVCGSLTLLEAVTAHGIRNLVFSSTCAIYGAPRTVPMDENHPVDPLSPYGATKLTVERMLADCRQATGLRSVALRYFNAAGADPDGLIGESHDPESHALPLAIQAVLGIRPHFSIFGTDYPTPDGTAVRDYVHVLDLADAHVRALAYLDAGGDNAAFNLGTGTGTSVRQLVDVVGQVAGRPVPVREDPRRPGDPPVLVASARHAGQTLGWHPRYTEFPAIVQTAWNWHTRPFSGFPPAPAKPHACAG